jgi:hypothetical protein
MKYKIDYKYEKNSLMGDRHSVIWHCGFFNKSSAPITPLWLEL